MKFLHIYFLMLLSSKASAFDHLKKIMEQTRNTHVHSYWEAPRNRNPQNLKECLLNARTYRDKTQEQCHKEERQRFEKMIKDEMWSKLEKVTKYNLIKNYYIYGFGVKSENFVLDFPEDRLFSKEDKNKFFFVNPNIPEVIIEPAGVKYIDIDALLADERLLNCDLVYENPLPSPYNDPINFILDPFSILPALDLVNDIGCGYTDKKGYRRHCGRNSCGEKAIYYLGWFDRKKHQDYITKLYEDENTYQAIVHSEMVNYVHKALFWKIYEDILNGKRPVFENTELREDLAQYITPLPAHKLPDYVLEEIEKYNEGIENVSMKFRYFVDEKTFYKIRKEVFKKIQEDREAHKGI